MTQVFKYINNESIDFQLKLFEHFQNLDAKEFGTYINYRSAYRPTGNPSRMWIREAI